MKKMLILYMLLLFSKLTVIAQSYDGNWYGQVQNANGNLKAEMNLKTSTNNQVTGQINILANGAKDIYNLIGNVSTNTVTGSLTYKDGTIFNFAMQLNS